MCTINDVHGGPALTDNPPRLFGYDQGVMGGLLTLNSFVVAFPEIDTTKAGELGLTAAEKSTRSTVQGMLPR